MGFKFPKLKLGLSYFIPPPPLGNLPKILCFLIVIPSLRNILGGLLRLTASEPARVSLAQAYSIVVVYIIEDIIPVFSIQYSPFFLSLFYFFVSSRRKKMKNVNKTGIQYLSIIFNKNKTALL